MTNSKVGYVYLIDEDLKIRWAGCADATPEEVTALETCTGILLQRLEQRKDKQFTPDAPAEVRLPRFLVTPILIPILQHV